jgi:UPF0755 protein
MKRRIQIIAVICFSAIAVFSVYIYLSLFTPMSSSGATKTIEVPRGASFRMIALELEREGVIKSAEAFSIVARFFKAYKGIKAGEYEFSAPMTQLEVLDMLMKGRVKRYLVTVPEGFNITEIAGALEKAGLAKADDFISRAMDARLALSLGIGGPTLEGYLFPDTYSFTKGVTVDGIISQMVDRFKGVYSREFAIPANERGMDMREVVTLASIIEKETGAPEERGIISSVFHNRLKKGIRLQSDPTVIYGIKGFDGNLTKRHLLQKTPYNTYARSGLPQGPIANPGRDSIRAAIYPAQGDYIYFVSKNNGTHFFSKTLKEHNRAVYEFQKLKTGRQG